MGWSERRVLCAAVVFRLVNCLVVRTAFVPDEFYQSVEPAHRLVFGSGHLTWEWRRGLRSYAYPGVLAAVFALLRLLGVDSRALVVAAPRLLQSVCAAVGDVHLFKLAKLRGGERQASFTLLAYWLSWFGFYCAPRTLTNGIETTLVLVGMSLYPWPPSIGSTRHTAAYVAVGAAATVLRPTAALFWAPLGLWHLARVRRRVRLVCGAVLPSAAAVVFVAALVDRLGYGRWVCSWYNFAVFNVFEGGSGYFGVHVWHWYLSTGLPSVLTTHLLPILIGIAASPNKAEAYVCGWYIFFHSLLAHKEQRFLLPIVPVLCIYAGKCLSLECKSVGGVWRAASAKSKWLAVFLLATNLPVALYTSVVHQRGAVDVTAYLHDEWRASRSAVVWFLTPCYSTPLHSHLHANMSALVLSCEPNLDGAVDYVDESDAFHAHPHQWLADRAVPFTAVSHIVLFEDVWSQLASQLSPKGFRVCARFFHAHILTGDHQSSYFVVEHNCNGTVVEHPEYGEVIQLTGDQRQNIKDFLCKVGIVKDENCKIHGF